jgi:hypothetical protein
MRKTLLFFILIAIGCTGVPGCKKPRIENVSKDKLSNQVDSVIYRDLKFGITKKNFSKIQKYSLTVNRMSEPVFNSIVTEVEDSITIETHPFKVFYYFDADDSLYRVKAQQPHQSSPGKHKATYTSLGMLIYHTYGVPVPWKTIGTWKKFIWELKNKQIILEYGCFEGDCFVECTVTELRLFMKNKKKGETVSAN